jgi:hypothetical protein
MEMVFLSQRGTVLSLFATGYISLRIAWDFPDKPLMGSDLMSLPGSQISKCFSAAFIRQVTRRPAKVRLT